jgi:hypothetical protein
MSLDHQQSSKEIVRHILFRLGVSQILDVVRRRRGRDTGHLAKNDLTEVFSDIYRNGIWIEHEGQDSLSGAGSVVSATDGLGIQLSGFLKSIDCRRLVDIGCGDFNWMRHVGGDFEYLGIDIVPSVIEANNAAYAGERRRFICMDATQQPIEPWGDVLICREVLFHLSLGSARRLLANIKAAGFKYVLLTSDTSIWFNSDIRNGDFRRINLSRSPFNLPAPQAQFADDKVSDGRVLAVWPGSAL